MSTPNRQTPLELPDFDRMEPATLSLSIPLIDNIIQIGLTGNNPRSPKPDRIGRLVIARTAHALSMHRTENEQPANQPLQVQIRDNRGEGVPYEVFDDPTPTRLTLGQLTSGGWEIDQSGDGPVRIAERDRLLVFLRKVGEEAIAKQHRTALPPEYTS